MVLKLMNLLPWNSKGIAIDSSPVLAVVCADGSFEFNPIRRSKSIVSMNLRLVC
jgi:hypothetical protein